MTRPKILIVEDEIIIAMTIRNILERKGYEVISSKSSGEEAISYINEHKPDLVLMDIILSGKLDGIQTVRKIKKFYHGAIIYLTAHSDASTMRRARRTHPHGYIVKPFKNEELYSTVDNALACSLERKTS